MDVVTSTVPFPDRFRAKVSSREATVTVVGLGYVGLPTAIAFARAGFRVVGADLDRRKVDEVNAGRSPIPEVEEADDIARLVSGKRLWATTDVDAACREGDAVLLIVPTPVTADKQPDLTFVRAAAESAARGARRGQLVVLESTTYPGTTEEFVVDALIRIAKLKPGSDVGVAYCPERYNPGDAEHPLHRVHRVVGAVTPEWAEATAALYGVLNGGRVTVVRDLKTAEAAKVIENVQRDLNIALVNELALIFERVGIDVEEVLDAAATKWNFARYSPGPGVGGHCLPVDPYYLTSLAQRLGYHSRVILAGRAVNDDMPGHVVDLVARGLNDARKPVNGSRVAVLGLAYKAATGDARESPARGVVHGLRALGADVRVADPFVHADVARALFGVAPAPAAEAARGADAVVLLTDHREFRDLTPARVAEVAAPACVIVDARAFYDREDVARAGLHYRGIGRRPA